MGPFVAAYPFSFVGSSEQERTKGVVTLATGTTFQEFQAQLATRVGLPPAQLQVVIACSRANEFDQLQKIPIHEGTNFNVILTQHNPARDKNVHFIVSPKMSAKDRIIVAQRKAMEAARADEDAAARLAASASGSPGSFTPDSAMLARLQSGQMAGGMMPQYSLPTSYGRGVHAPPAASWVPPGGAAPLLFSGAGSPGRSAGARILPGTSAPSGGTSGMSGVLSHMLQQAAAAATPEAAPDTRAALLGPGTMPRVTPFPEGMLRAVHAQHSSCGGEGEGEFWRTSPRDRMVMGFRGPSPFGAVGTKIRVS